MKPTGARDIEWETPAWLFERLDREFGFTLDVCAMPWNAKCPRWFSPTEDGIEQPWGAEVCWMNPPYRELEQWVDRAYVGAQCGATVVCLIPARTDTRWWHEFVMRAHEVRFIRGRLKFSDLAGGQAALRAPFSSVIVVFRPGPVPAGGPRMSAIERQADVLEVEAEEVVA